MPEAETQHRSKMKLLDAAMQVIRTKGYSATRIEDVCAAAGLTKGSFFHHFESKEELALAAADHFAAMADRIFAAAPYQSVADPLDRLLGYVDFRRSILQGELPDYTCLLGTMVQEAYATQPAIRAACERHISAHAGAVARDIAAAKDRYAPDAPWTPEALALFTQAVIQGAFVLAKAKGGPEIAAECLDHLRRYLESQFHRSPTKEASTMSSKQKITSSSKIVPHLWFEKDADKAAKFYASIFPDSRVDRVTPIPADTPSGPAGSVDVVEFTLAGQPFMAISAGPLDPFNHAISFMVNCADQAEIDRYWDALSAGGTIEQCGWLRDRYGVSWQIVPTVLGEMMTDPDRARARRVTEAFSG